MDWVEAKDLSLDQWRALLAAIGRRDPGELIAWVNAAYGLCDKAREVAQERGEPRGSLCRLCLAYQQRGGCLEARDRLAAALLAGDLDKAREVARGLIADLELLEVPQGST